MPIESATYIDGLNASNPVGSADKVQTLDDHIRLLKSTIKASFPNVAGAVTPTHTELNYVDGVTSALQTQIDGKAASSHNHSAAELTSGTIPDARFPATLPAVSGANLTNLDASDLASGTVPDARFPATLPAVSGANLTNLDASDLASGTIPDARLSSEVVLRNTALTLDGGSAADVGYLGAPKRTISSTGSTVAGDSGKMLVAAGASITITIDDTVHPDDTVLAFLGVGSGSSNTTISISGATLYLAGTGFATSGNRTLLYGGIAVAYKLDGNTWLIAGDVT